MQLHLVKCENDHIILKGFIEDKWGQYGTTVEYEISKNDLRDIIAFAFTDTTANNYETYPKPI